jgi:DNA mismatch endonuclease (patch repair protein)
MPSSIACEGKSRAKDSGEVGVNAMSGRSAGGRNPPPLNPSVSRQMSRMPRTSTGPELALRRALHGAGLRFRVGGAGLPGRPDIVFTRVRIAVFVDGCFWHRCPLHATAPRNNAGWWATKLDRNVARDREKDELLAGLGWSVVHVWEHEDPHTVAGLIHGMWQAKKLTLTARRQVANGS